MRAAGIKLPYLRAWREWRALKQEELAKLAGITETTISRVENGMPARIDTIGKLADALKVERERLIRAQPSENAA